jgi:hypothetical protein
MLLLVTLVGVFCCITSRIMMHMENHDDQELYITSIPIHVSERCIPSSRRDKPRITAQASNRR